MSVPTIRLKPRDNPPTTACQKAAVRARAKRYQLDDGHTFDQLDRETLMAVLMETCDLIDQLDTAAADAQERIGRWRRAS